MRTLRDLASIACSIVSIAIEDVKLRRLQRMKRQYVMIDGYEADSIVFDFPTKRGAYLGIPPTLSEQDLPDECDWDLFEKEINHAE